MTNIQDFAMVHVGFEAPTRIGEFCSITHHTTVVIGDHCLIGVGTAAPSERLGSSSVEFGAGSHAYE